MSSLPFRGRAMTVLGPTDPGRLGLTLIHEHLLHDGSGMFALPSCPSEQALAFQPVSIENLWWLRYHVVNNMDNLKLLDESVAVSEAMRFKLEGGETIVDASSHGRDPLGLARISRATGLNIVMGSGYYREEAHPAEVERMSEDDLAAEILGEFRDGVLGTGIRPGIIGEIGCSWPWLDSEKKVLRAAVLAQKETGAPLVIHPGNDQGAAMQIAEELARSGADFARTVMCHVDVRILDMERMLELAATGLYLEYDLFGMETHCSPRMFMDIPNDAHRINQISTLIEKGYLERILISQDICTKNRLVRYGGHGYDHIVRNIVPWMREKGLGEEQVGMITVENPKRLLTLQ